MNGLEVVEPHFLVKLIQHGLHASLCSKVVSSQDETKQQLSTERNSQVLCQVEYFKVSQPCWTENKFEVNRLLSGFTHLLQMHGRYPDILLLWSGLALCLWCSLAHKTCRPPYCLGHSCSLTLTTQKARRARDKERIKKVFNMTHSYICNISLSLFLQTESERSFCCCILLYGLPQVSTSKRPRYTLGCVHHATQCATYAHI